MSPLRGHHRPDAIWHLTDTVSYLWAQGAGEWVSTPAWQVGEKVGVAGGAGARPKFLPSWAAQPGCPSALAAGLEGPLGVQTPPSLILMQPQGRHVAGSGEYTSLSLGSSILEVDILALPLSGRAVSGSLCHGLHICNVGQSCVSELVPVECLSGASCLVSVCMSRLVDVTITSFLSQ